MQKIGVTARDTMLATKEAVINYTTILIAVALASFCSGFPVAHLEIDLCQFLENFKFIFSLTWRSYRT